MSGTFMQILWGMLFVLIDVKLQNFDVALDVIGYVMIVGPLGRLAPAAAAFGTARPFALIAGVVSLPAMIPIEPLQPFWFLQTVLDVFMIWYLCSGIIDLANARANAALVMNATSVRTLNVLASTSALFVTVLAAIVRDRLVYLAIPLIALLITVAVLTLLLVKRASAEIA